MICNKCVKQDVCMLKQNKESEEKHKRWAKEHFPNAYKPEWYEVDCKHRHYGTMEEIKKQFVEPEDCEACDIEVTKADEGGYYAHDKMYDAYGDGDTPLEAVKDLAEVIQDIAEIQAGKLF